MGDHHSKKILTLLSAWQNILNLESGAISDGDFKKLEDLFHQSSIILKHLEKLFSSLDPAARDRDTLDMMKKIYEQQGKNIQILQDKTDSLGQELGSLRKSKASIGGYKQKKISAPRFKNEHM